MDLNWDQIEAYNRAPEDEDEDRELRFVTAKKVMLHTNKHMGTITSLAAKGHSKTNVAKIWVFRFNVSASWPKKTT